MAKDLQERDSLATDSVPNGNSFPTPIGANSLDVVGRDDKSTANAQHYPDTSTVPSCAISVHAIAAPVNVPPDLKYIVDAWPSLSDAVKARILATVRSVCR